MSDVLVKTESLFKAIQDNQYETAKYLLENGANPNRLLLNGVTPFHIAIAAQSTSSFEYVNLILEHKGNPNVQNVDGLTPFHIAAIWGKADCLNLILRNGADISVCDKEGHDVTWYARENLNCKFIVDAFLADLQDRETSCDVDVSLCNNARTPSAMPFPRIVQKELIECAVKSTSPQTCSTSNSSTQTNGLNTVLHSAEESTSSADSCASDYGSTDFQPTDTLHFGINATSPDHCVFFMKPNNDNHVKQHNSYLHDTMVVRYNGDALKEVQSHEYPCDTSSNCSDYEISSVSPLHSGSSDNANFESISDNSIHSMSSLSEEIQKQMLLSTKPNVDPRPEDCSKPAYFHGSIHDVSFYSASDSTVPINVSEHNHNRHHDELTSLLNNSSDHKCCSHSKDDHTVLESTHLPNYTTTFLPKPPDVSKIHDSSHSISLQCTDGCSESKTQLASSLCSSSLSSSNQESSIPIKLSVSGELSDDNTIIYDWQSLDCQDSIDEVSCEWEESVHVPDHISKMSDDEIRNELMKYGQNPGPIRYARILYEKRLQLLRQGRKFSQAKSIAFSRELHSVILGRSLSKLVTSDDDQLRKEFDDPSASQNLRGGSAKDSFNYLLLDPRVTKNLPQRADDISEAEALKIFAGATFYVGKGKKSRPYAHLKEAVKHKNKKQNSRKIEHIQEIWASNNGVISLHVFQNLIPCEAFTRESAMIDAFGLQHLTNHVRGKCYGSAASWSGPRLRQYGTFLILRAMQILLLEGERQIRPHQISKKKKVT
ncbi:unnamed protein product [Clavelina lepadiformis]|uniref:LEM domain-containing protein n=1 Tax=Clavelina lepadiformis TaxID=159417 RepID=A0ABP0GQU0_CLALP